MELQGLRRPARPFSGPSGGEREQMLNLNQRLESYLSHVKLLDEENARLAEEIRALRRNHRGSMERRRFMEEELRNARLEVDEVWRERVCAEVDVTRLMEEVRGLGLQLQRETQAQVEAKAKADHSRKELEEERRAQMWLREKVDQLEHEMKSLIQSHQEEVDHMEALLMQPRPTRPAALQQGPNLLELGQEYSQRAATAWQEAARAHQDQLTRLEEAAGETRQKLVQVNREKSESALKLQNLDRELLGLQDLREHLESTVEQQREGYCRDVQMLQEHLEDLEREKHALTQKMDQLLQENRGLVQMKMSLNLEVATYRALLDNESLKGGISLQKQQRNIYSRDAAFSPWGVKDNYQMSPGPKTISTSLDRGMTGKTKPQVIMVTPPLYQKYVPRTETLEISKENVENKRVYQKLELTPYPKVLKNGAVENFRPQEVQEKVTYAEPLSPPDEQEGLGALEVEKDGDFWNDTVDQPSEEVHCSESQVSYQVQSSFNSETPHEETSQLPVEPALTEETTIFSMKSELLEKQIEKENLDDQQPCEESNLSHKVESNIAEPISDANLELGGEPFTEDSCTVTFKSERQDMSFGNEEIEKPQELIEATYVNKTEQMYEEENLSHEEFINEAHPEIVGEPLTEGSATVIVKPETQDLPLANEVIEKSHVPTDAWTEVERVDKTEETRTESNLSQVELEPNYEESFNETAPELVEEPLIEESCTIVGKSELQTVPSESDEIEKPEVPIVAWTEKESTEGTEDLPKQQESSDSETEAFVEPNFDTKSSSPASEESLKLGDVIKEDFPFDGVGVSRGDASPPKEKLYPDGEEMDTWDSVMEQNQDIKEENEEETEEATRQQAEPEDISVTEAQQQQQQQEMIQDVGMEAKAEPQTVLDEQNNLTEENLQDDEQEDSQNVSVSWRTELEGDSYALDNTLADTRPLIRYKSDDTDANTQASHVDDVDDSSDSEQDRKVGEMVSGAWIDDKTRKFGTMEDLCEEAEGEVLDEEEYDLEYLRQDGKDDAQDNTQENYDDSQEEEIKTVVEEELDTDKLVEQELENLSTECYTTHFARHQASAKDVMEHDSFAEQPKAWKEALEDMPEPVDMEDFLTVDAQAEHKGDELSEVPQIDKEEDKELVENEGEKHDISMVTHYDPTEDVAEEREEFMLSSTNQELSFNNASMEQTEQENIEEQQLMPCDASEAITEVRKEFVLSSTSQELSFDDAAIEQKEQEKMEEHQSVVQDLSSSLDARSVADDSKDDVNKTDKPTSPDMLPDDEVEIRDTTPEEIFVPEEVNTELPNVSSTTDWKIAIENSMEMVDCDEIETVGILSQKDICSDDKLDEDSVSSAGVPLNMSPERVHEDVDLFIVKDSKALLKTNGKANLDDLYSIGGNNDFWASSLETGATYQPENVNAKHAEWKLGFRDEESRQSETVVSTSNIAFEQKEVTQFKTVVKGEIVHSEESEDDSEAMSSGEE